ncbi:MAG: alanine--tRNA ligase [Thermoplasmata archaeon]|nr:alanine--tRNA ligase [Thermoplasmata archaeon]
MDPSEYQLAFFQREGFQRRACAGCGEAFWTLGDHTRCQEEPCTPYGFLGHSPLKRPYSADEMREAYLGFFERRGHTRLRRYPTVARWRNDVFFTQASIYDFQPWVTSGAIPPPANPLTISQPCLRFNDLVEVGHSGRHHTMFEMMAHHAFNRPDHEVYFKDRCTELCHEWYTSELGADPRLLTYKEEAWEGGGNLGPSLSVGILGLEVATLVFMEYTRDGAATKPMPLTVVDTGYGLERNTWLSQGTRSTYEAVFGGPYDELRRTFPPADAAVLVDHARSLNFLLVDGVVPSNSKAGYFARLVLRRMLRVLAKAPEAPELVAVVDRAGRELARVFPEMGEHRDDLHRVIEAEIERYRESIERARGIIRRTEERLQRDQKTVVLADLLGWFDSLGVPPDVAASELQHPPLIPADFYQQVAKLHEAETPATDYSGTDAGAPEVPAAVPPTEVLYYLDPYTLTFEAHVVFATGPFVVLDRTYFYPTGGGQVTDTGHLNDTPVVEVLRKGPWVVHRLDAPTSLQAGHRVRGRIDGPRRTQLMQHHTATHLLNGALRQQLGPHVWQAGAYKGPEGARIDITHFKALSPGELREVERAVNRVVRESRPVKSYFEPRNEAERRFGFTLYQGGAVPGRELRIVEVDGFDVEACGGTHCTKTSEVGLVTIQSTERIQDGIVRVNFAAGERALDVYEHHMAALASTARSLGVGPDEVPKAVERLMAEAEEARREARAGARHDFGALADRLLLDGVATHQEGGVTVTVTHLDLDRNGLQEVARALTRRPGHVAILSSERDGRGILFVASSVPALAADKLFARALPEFAGRGGGNASAATGVGEPGAALEQARAAAATGALDVVRTTEAGSAP